MKTLFILIAFLGLGITPPPTNANMTSEGQQPLSITKADVDSVSYLMGYSLGMQITQNDFGPLDCSHIIRGVKDACQGIEIDYEMFREAIESFLEKRHEAIATEMKQRSDEMLAANALKDGVVTTPSGLQYKIIREGSNLMPTRDDMVEVHYEGKNLDGIVFDSTYERGQTIEFSLERIIPGWAEGIQHIGEGGEIMLWIPAELAYGERGAGAVVRPNEALIFRIELISVKKNQATPAASY